MKCVKKSDGMTSFTSPKIDEINRATSIDYIMCRYSLETCRGEDVVVPYDISKHLTIKDVEDIMGMLTVNSITLGGRD